MTIYKYDFVCRKCGCKFTHHKLRDCPSCGSFGVEIIKDEETAEFKRLLREEVVYLMKTLKELNVMSKKPKCQLIGFDGNAFFILAKVRKVLKDAGLEDQMEAFIKEATSSDYDNLLRTAMKYVDVE